MPRCPPQLTPSIYQSSRHVYKVWKLLCHKREYLHGICYANHITHGPVYEVIEIFDSNKFDQFQVYH